MVVFFYSYSSMIFPTTSGRTSNRFYNAALPSPASILLHISVMSMLTVTRLCSISPSLQCGTTVTDMFLHVTSSTNMFLHVTSITNLMLHHCAHAVTRYIHFIGDGFRFILLKALLFFLLVNALW
jgi:hypothetical protein